MQDIMTLIVNEHRAKRKASSPSHVDADLVDLVLLTHQEMEVDESISEENVKAVTWDAFMGGTETTVSIMEWAMAHLLQNLPILEKLRMEIDSEVGRHRRVAESDIPQLKYLQAIVKEAFRLHPPVPLSVAHQSHEPCTVGGYHIPAYARVHLNLWGMGRDATIWQRPLEFSPERFQEDQSQIIDPVPGQSFELLPFGSGRRICPAASLGSVTAQLVVASLVHAFDISLPVGRIDMKVTDARLVIRMETPLQLYMQPRLPLELY